MCPAVGESESNSCCRPKIGSRGGHNNAGQSDRDLKNRACRKKLVDFGYRICAFIAAAENLLSKTLRSGIYHQ